MDSFWTPERYQEAVENQQFIVVTPIGVPRVNVTDIKPIWVLKPEFVFNPKYRVAGKKEDIIKDMTNAGYDDEQLAEIINDTDENSITKDNIESLTDEDGQLVYDVEVANYEQWRDDFLKSKEDVKGLTLFELLKMVNPHMSMVEEKKVFPRIPTTTTTTTNKSVKPSPSPKGKVGRKSTALQEKVNKALDEDKIINVTNITATGTGTTTGVRRTRTRLFVAPNLPITSSKLQGVLTAIDLLGGEDEHPEDLQAALEFNWGDSSSPKTTPKTASTTATSTTAKPSIAPSKTVVPEAVQPIRKNLLPPPIGKKPTSVASGLAVPESSEI